MRRSAPSLLVTSLLCCVLGPTGGCTLDNPGDPPPEAKLYLPSGLLLSPGTADRAARFMFVVNSNFDLRYNAGSLQAYDLDALDAEIGECDELGARDCEIDPERVLADEVLVPSLATYLAASSDGERLYVAARTQTNLTYVDVDVASERPLDCGGDDRSCGDAYVRYDDPLSSERRLGFPREAVAITAVPASEVAEDVTVVGDFLLVAHRGGEVSLFLDSGAEGLQLQDVLVLGGSGRPLRELTGVAFDPVTRLAYVSVYARDSFEISDKKVLARVGIALSDDPDYPASLYDAGVLSMEGVSLGRDTRAVTMNPLVEGQALVVTRAPNSLMWVDVQEALEEGGPTQAPVRQTEIVGRGPSRVVTGVLGDRTVAVVSCFDSRQIFILDAATAEPLSIVHNFSGPFELALDSVRQRLYVADNLASVLRVLDLSALVGGASETLPTARIVATIGTPQVVQELK